MSWTSVFAAQPIIIDSRCADVTAIPSAWITAAKSNLHIAYGHTSHGGQVTDGMTGLVGFTGGCGGPQFAWNDGGISGALDLHEAWVADLGWSPWELATRTYLDSPANADVNVVMWAWCSTHSTYSEQDMINNYFVPMAQLELDYPHVTFVYMTGPLDYGKMVVTNARNQQIRDFCIANNKVLYDFADIESCDPDGVYYPWAHASCDYWNSIGSYQGNWAEIWQSNHVQGVDWYVCNAAHTMPLNANQKAYCAWWLWAMLAGWPAEPLRAAKTSLSASATDSVEFWLNADTTNAGRSYHLLGSGSGTTPGLALPGGLVTVSLNFDALFLQTITMANTSVFSGFAGTLDASGQGKAVLQTLGPVPPSALGFAMHFAFVLDSPFDYASNPVWVVISP